jgi:UDP-glucose 4-epimerase
MKNILITGAGGYIGSHVLRLLSKIKDFNITVIDNFENGYREPIDIISKESQANIEIAEFDIINQKDFSKLKNVQFDGVLHFAGLIQVSESLEKPLEYFENNVTGSINLLKYIVSSKSDNLIFSSTSAVYSSNEKVPFTEKTRTDPQNPYAESKLMVEKVINWSVKAYPFKSIILRYFNPCGCSLDGKLGYSKLPSGHLMTNAVRGALGLEEFKILCGKVDTPDGTTIRDYFNILDLAEAHKIALEALLKGHEGGTYNVGIGKGHSLLEILDIVKKVTKKDFNVSDGTPRKGEIPVAYSNSNKFKKEFNWKPKYSLEQAVASLVKWFRRKPSGYSY